jgi:ATP-dependent DNA helicase RecQ
MDNQLQVVVSTVAFGLGVDKGDVRFVIHFNLPPSLDAFYQESGRAGRDGQDATALLLLAHQDVKAAEFNAQRAQPGDEGGAGGGADGGNGSSSSGSNKRGLLSASAAIERRLQKLAAMVEWAESTTCRRALLLAYFGEKLTPEVAAPLRANKRCCDCCQSPKQVEDNLKLAKGVQRMHMIALVIIVADLES